MGIFDLRYSEKFHKDFGFWKEMYTPRVFGYQSIG